MYTDVYIQIQMYTNVCTQMTTVIIMQYQLSRFRSQRFTDLTNQFGKLLLTADRHHVFPVLVNSIEQEL